MSRSWLCRVISSRLLSWSCSNGVSSNYRILVENSCSDIIPAWDINAFALRISSAFLVSHSSCLLLFLSFTICTISLPMTVLSPSSAYSSFLIFSSSLLYLYICYISLYLSSLVSSHSALASSLCNLSLSSSLTADKSILPFLRLSSSCL